MSTRKKNVLWLDDDFELDPSRLDIWVNAFQHANANLIKVARLNEFAAELETRSSATPNNANYIDVILIDVMMRPSVIGENFKALGFDKPCLALDAGVQLLGFIKNPSRKPARPAWLKAYSDRTIVLLTAHINVQSAWTQHVEHAVREVTQTLRKNDAFASHDRGPDESFKAWVASL